MSRSYCSPLTGDRWEDVRPVAAVILGCSLVLDAQYPRRRIGAEFPAALARAVGAVSSFARLPNLARSDAEIGAALSDVYWEAKAAKVTLHTFVDEIFLRHFDFWPQWREWVRGNAGSDHITTQYDPPVSFQLRAARLAWLAVYLVEKAAAGGHEVLDEFSLGHDALQGALWELDEAGVPRTRAFEIERAWRFLAAAGRMPRLPQDADLYAAFEAALLAGADELAVELVQRGSGA